jgi:hypothetical protein
MQNIIEPISLVKNATVLSMVYVVEAMVSNRDLNRWWDKGSIGRKGGGIFSRLDFFCFVRIRYDL